MFRRQHAAASRTARKSAPGLSQCTRFVVILSLFLLCPRAARADARECINHHSEGQLLRDQAHFLDARAHFVGCAEASCPATIAAECADLLADLERAIPTVVLAARDEARRDLAGVRVELDGQAFDGALNGRAIPLDPGPHRFRFVAPDGRVQEIEAVVLESIKGRVIEVQFAALPAATPSVAPAVSPEPGAAALASPSDVTSTSSDGQRTLAYVLGGIGVAALASSGYFAWTGRGQRQDLADTCAPSCTEEQVSPVRSKYLVADILLAVGVTSLGAGAYLFFQTPDRLPTVVQNRGLVMGVRSAF